MKEVWERVGVRVLERLRALALWLSHASTRLLVALGLVSLLCYLVITWLSYRFLPLPEPGQEPVPHRERPIVAVLVWFGVAFVCYLAAVIVVRSQTSEVRGQKSEVGGLTSDLRPLTSDAVVLGFALAFRLVQLLAYPIQEIDIYRYLWDGRVTLAGVNPYAYSPEQVRSQLSEVRGRKPEVRGQKSEDGGEPRLTSDLRPLTSDAERLAELVQRDSPMERILLRVDHGRVPTVYPPLSQAVFALAASLTSPDAPPPVQIRCMKLVLIVFDLGTIAVLVALLRAFGRPASECIIYAWCPLVIKEIANSGHLDAIAVFFTTLSVFLLIRGRGYLAAVAWAFAILSKVYPIVLLPLIVRQLWNLESVVRCPLPVASGAGSGATDHGPRTTGLSLRCFLPLLLAAGLVAATYYMVWPARSAGVPPAQGGHVPAAEGGQDARPPGRSTPFKGLGVFLTEWEMNDPLFHLVFDGVDHLLGRDVQDGITRRFAAWWPQRIATVEPGRYEPVKPSFLIAYLLVALVVGGFTIWLALRPWPEESVVRCPLSVASGAGSLATDHGPRTTGFSVSFVEGVFYTLAVLFLLSPTANPWYLVWAVPFLPWARQWSWLLLTGLVFQYYLRFHFSYQWDTFDDPHRGDRFFHDVWIWIEYLPFYVALAGELLWRWLRPRTTTS